MVRIKLNFLQIKCPVEWDFLSVASREAFANPRKSKNLMYDIVMWPFNVKDFTKTVPANSTKGSNYATSETFKLIITKAESAFRLAWRTN